MTVEEAVAFCVDRDLSVEYYAPEKSWHIYPGIGELSTGPTLVAAVLAAMMKYPGGELDRHLAIVKSEAIDGHVCGCCQEDKGHCPCDIHSKFDRNGGLECYYCFTHRRGI
mgnify:CR=1 FL=1